jgi:hypothetical protein
VSSAEPNLPSDLQSVIDELALSEQGARRVIEGLTDTQLKWQPHDGAAWSIAQCLDHLGRINTTYAAALHAAVQTRGPAALPRRGPIRPGWFSRFFIRSMDAPPSRKFNAPTRAKPSSQIEGGQALTSFVDSHDPIRSLIHRGLDLDFNRIRFKNPFVSLLRFTVGTGLMIILAHDRRHLWQAEQVRNSLPGQHVQ